MPSYHAIFFRLLSFLALTSSGFFYTLSRPLTGGCRCYDRLDYGYLLLLLSHVLLLIMPHIRLTRADIHSTEMDRVHHPFLCLTRLSIVCHSLHNPLSPTFYTAPGCLGLLLFFSTLHLEYLDLYFRNTHLSCLLLSTSHLASRELTLSLYAPLCLV